LEDFALQNVFYIAVCWRWGFYLILQMPIMYIFVMTCTCSGYSASLLLKKKATCYIMKYYAFKPIVRSHTGTILHCLECSNHTQTM